MKAVFVIPISKEQASLTSLCIGHPARAPQCAPSSGHETSSGTTASVAAGHKSAKKCGG